MSSFDEWHPPSQPDMPTGPDSFPATGVNSLSTFATRGLARVIDSLLIGLPVVLVSSIALVASGVDSDDAVMPRWASVLWFVLAVVYEAGMVTWRGQTVGKLIMGIKVGRIDNGRPPLWWQSAIRIVLPAAAAGFPFEWAMVIYVAVFSTAAWDPMRRGLHDKAGGTVVVVAR